jgi:hypothetical protein
VNTARLTSTAGDIAPMKIWVHGIPTKNLADRMPINVEKWYFYVAGTKSIPSTGETVFCFQAFSRDAMGK